METSEVLKSVLNLYEQRHVNSRTYSSLQDCFPAFCAGFHFSQRHLPRCHCQAEARGNLRIIGMRHRIYPKIPCFLVPRLCLEMSVPPSLPGLGGTSILPVVDGRDEGVSKLRKWGES